MSVRCREQQQGVWKRGLLEDVHCLEILQVRESPQIVETKGNSDP